MCGSTTQQSEVGAQFEVGQHVRISATEATSPDMGLLAYPELKTGMEGVVVSRDWAGPRVAINGFTNGSSDGAYSAFDHELELAA